MSLFHLIYTSRAAGDVSERTLLTIQEQALQYNPRAGITGVLLYSAGNFMQILEGDAVAVSRLYSGIATDSRHTDVQCLYFDPTPERVFPAWSIRIFNLDANGGHPDRGRIRDLLTKVSEGTTARERWQQLVGVLEMFRTSYTQPTLHAAIL